MGASIIRCFMYLSSFFVIVCAVLGCSAGEVRHSDIKEKDALRRETAKKMPGYNDNPEPSDER